MNGNVTIKDVALKSNTSVGTVSRFLNGARCSEPRRQRIEAAIRELQYVPNLHARAVRALSSNCIGILLCEISARDSFWIQTLVISLIQSISNAGYRSFIQVIDEHGENYDSLQLAGNMDGLVLIGHFSSRFFSFLNKGEIPAVTYWEKLPYENGISVKVELSAGMMHMVEHLVAMGHRKIGVISNHYEINSEKVECFLAEIRRYIPDYDTSLIESSESHKPSTYGAESTAALLDRHPDVTAVFYLSDSFLLGGLGELGRRRKRIPQDISVVSFDNSLVSVNTVPETTCVGLDYERLGSEMIGALVDRMEGKDRKKEPMVALDFYRRGSTGKAS